MPRFTMTLQSTATEDEGVHALRGALKVLLRRYGLRAISVVQESTTAGSDSGGWEQEK